MIDASNPQFNKLGGIFYNTKILCTSISMNVNNCDSPTVDFYIQGGQSTMAHSNRNIRTRNGNSS